MGNIEKWRKDCNGSMVCPWPPNHKSNR